MTRPALQLGIQYIYNQLLITAPVQLRTAVPLLHSARVSWSTAQGGVSDAVLEELPHPSGVCLGQGDGSCSPQKLCEVVPVTPGEERVEGTHHVVAYFKESATVTCEFCGKPRFLVEE